jgi:UDP-glucose 4-epimerase
LNVSDAAEAFVASLAHGPDAVRRYNPDAVSRYNVGSGVGASVMEIVKAAERVTGQPVPVVHRPPAAEPARLLSDVSRALAELGWKPRHSIVDEILRDAWSATYARARD